MKYKMGLKIILTTIFCIISGLITGYIASNEELIPLFCLAPGFIFSIAVSTFNFQHFRQKLAFIIISSSLWPIIPILSGAFSSVTLTFKVNGLLYDLLFSIATILGSILGAILVFGIFEFIGQANFPFQNYLKLSLVIGTLVGVINFVFPFTNQTAIAASLTFLIWEVAVGSLIAYVDSLSLYQYAL